VNEQAVALRFSNVKSGQNLAGAVRRRVDERDPGDPMEMQEKDGVLRLKVSISRLRRKLLASIA
jgi:hypothetical protein